MHVGFSKPQSGILSFPPNPKQQQQQLGPQSILSKLYLCLFIRLWKKPASAYFFYSKFEIVRKTELKPKKKKTDAKSLGCGLDLILKKNEFKNS